MKHSSSRFTQLPAKEFPIEHYKTVGNKNQYILVDKKGAAILKDDFLQKKG